MQRNRNFWWAVLASSLLAILGSLSAATEETGENRARSNYRDLCSGCHGPTGKGDGPMMANFSPRPRDLSNCKLMKDRSDEDLFSVISKGSEVVGVKSDMQGWSGVLSDEEIHELVKLVRGFCKQP
jgi:mono/diheme cytochrome c family protein